MLIMYSWWKLYSRQTIGRGYLFSQCLNGIGMVLKQWCMKFLYFSRSCYQFIDHRWWNVLVGHVLTRYRTQVLCMNIHTHAVRAGAATNQASRTDSKTGNFNEFKVRLNSYSWFVDCTNYHGTNFVSCNWFRRMFSLSFGIRTDIKMWYLV